VPDGERRTWSCGRNTEDDLMSDRRLDGRVAVVTGSGRGIGREIAERFASEGATVVINYASRDAEASEAMDAIAAAGGKALTVKADISRSPDVRRLVEETMHAFGRIDILVNNAGVHIAKDLFDTTEDDWNRTMDVNLRGAYLCSREVAPIMANQQYGRIVMMSSNSGLYHPSAMRFVEYVASKAGMNGLTKALALRLGPHITVNAVCPGWIRTEMLEAIDDATHQRILEETALRRWGTPKDIADATLFLASDEAAFVTGELLIVAGGRGMH
jgi:3-oxoacyl-[acyl-carrier protein] reductase